MADPRGNGFNKGRGKWHRPQASTAPSITPDDYGFSLVSDVDARQVWQRGNTCIMYRLQINGWVTWQADEPENKTEHSRTTLTQLLDRVDTGNWLDWLNGPIPFNGEPVTVADDDNNGLAKGVDY